MSATPIERQQQCHRGGDHECHAGNVERVRTVVPWQTAQGTRRHHQRDGAQRQIDPENERPVQVIGEQSAEHRAENARAHKHDGRVALCDRALARRKKVGDYGLRDWNQPAAADSLQDTADDQHPHRRRQRTGQRAEDENADRQQHDGAAAVNVGEFTEERRCRSRSDQIGGYHPGKIVEIGKALADRR